MTFKSKNTKHLYIIFVTILTLSLFFSCKTSKPYYNYKIEGKKIEISKNKTSDLEIDNFVFPYRTKINKDLDSILSFCPETLDKSKGKWQSNIGDFLADITFEIGNPIFKKQENKEIDIVFLNQGGIRSIIAKGNVSARTAFEVLPFENELVIVELTGLEIKEMVDFFILEKKPHPIYGIKIYLDKENKLKKFEIDGKAVKDNDTYFVGTSYYLANGGDNMTFFNKGKNKYSLNYKMRDLLIDYFKKVKTIPINKTEKVIIK